MPAGASVGFPGTQQLYAALLDRRQQAASWKAACTGARALGGLFCRAKVTCCSSHIAQQGVVRPGFPTPEQHTASP